MGSPERTADQPRVRSGTKTSTRHLISFFFFPTGLGMGGSPGESPVMFDDHKDKGTIVLNTNSRASQATGNLARLFWLEKCCISSCPQTNPQK